MRQQVPGAVLVERIEHHEAISGALGVADRPDLQRLKELSGRKAFDRIHVYDLSRLTRAADLRERAAVWGFVVDANAVFADCQGSTIDPSTDAGEMEFFFKTKASAAERKMIKARTIGGRMRAAIAGGKPQGPTVYGYAYKPETRQWSIDADRAKVLRSMFEWAAWGVSCRQIAIRLEQQSVKPPRWPWAKAWPTSTVAHLLRSRVYLDGAKTYVVGGEWKELPNGKRARAGGEEFRTQLPPIVEPDLWHAVQAAVKARTDHNGHPGTGGQALLRKRGVCGLCENTLYVIAGGKSGLQYVCSGRLTDRRSGEAVKVVREPCRAPKYAVDAIDAAVWQAIAAALMDRDLLKKALEEREPGNDSSGWEAQVEGADKVLA